MSILEITRNKYILHDDYAEMIIISNEEEFRSKVDLDDIKRLRDIPWWYNRQTGYVQTKRLSLQRYVMNTPKKQITDHINGDKLDNRKCNLRFVTPLQSQMNTKRVGVGYRKTTGKYRAYVNRDRKYISLGEYKTYEEACEAREKYEIEHFGEFRRIDKFQNRR